MRMNRHNALHFGKKVRIKHQLKHMFRMRAAFQFGVSDLVTEVTQI